MRYAHKKKIILCGVTVVALMIILHPDLNARRSYEYLAKSDIFDNLHKEVAANFTSSAAIDCDYRDTLEDDTTISIRLVDADLIEGHKIKDGGEYAPQECKPKFSTAIIVPYRDTPEQLRGFLVYMHIILRRQKIHYRIYVIEQADSRPFNRAKLFNVGAVAAMKAGYPCLVLHDLDMLPLRPANIYGCTEQPRHMSASINQFRFVLPYLKYINGVIAIVTKQYKAVNGMSNEYFGWSGEYDDFYARLEAYNIKVCRFEPATSRYHMYRHISTSRGQKSMGMYDDAKSKISADGLSTMKYAEVATVIHTLFTHIVVEF